MLIKALQKPLSGNAAISFALIALIAFSMFAMLPIQKTKADPPAYKTESQLMELGKRIKIKVYDGDTFKYERQLVNTNGQLPWYTKKSYFQNSATFPSDNLMLRFEDTSSESNDDDWMDASIDISYWPTGGDGIPAGTVVVWVWGFKGDYCKQLYFKQDNGTWWYRKGYYYPEEGTTENEAWTFETCDGQADIRSLIVLVYDEEDNYLYTRPLFNNDYSCKWWAKEWVVYDGSPAHFSLGFEDLASQSAADNYADLNIEARWSNDSEDVTFGIYATGGYRKKVYFDGEVIFNAAEDSSCTHQTWLNATTNDWDIP